MARDTVDRNVFPPVKPIAILEELKANLEGLSAHGQGHVRLTLDADRIRLMIRAIEAGPDFALYGAVVEARNAFQSYRASHWAKAAKAWLPSTREARVDKALVNARLATTMEAALQRARSFWTKEEEEADGQR